MKHNNDTLYDIVVVGAGPAGCMAAIQAERAGASVLLIERNDTIGKKILKTGNGRCNLTNTAPADVFLSKFYPQGKFLRTALQAFSPDDLIGFFRENGLACVVEEQGRVYPATHEAQSVVRILLSVLKKHTIEICYNARVQNIRKDENTFIIDIRDKKEMIARKIVIATGGASYTATGSTGDGTRFARQLGHTVDPWKPALVPLIVKENWVKKLPGISLKGVRVNFLCEKKQVDTDTGDILFTHFGVSGPLILDISGILGVELQKHAELPIAVDCQPQASRESIENSLRDIASRKGAFPVSYFLKDVFPKAMISSFFASLSIAEHTPLNQISKKNRCDIVNRLKKLPLTIVGTMPLDTAMVSLGGVSLKEIDPRTMGSKLIPGLYFAGETIDCTASSGGFNLQQAFSTGYLAGTMGPRRVSYKKILRVQK